MWNVLTEADVLTRLAGPEVAALKTVALAAGQANPLPEIVTQACHRVRGALEAAGYTLPASNAIPEELEGAALDIIRWRLINRLPGMKMLATPEREKDFDDAVDLLKQVAAGKFKVVPIPAEEAAEEQTFAPAPKFFGTTKVQF